MQRPVMLPWLLLLWLAVLCLPASGAVAQLKSWDQQQVTDLAQQLVPATDKLYKRFYQQPEQEFEGSDGFDFQDRIRLLHLESKHLAGALKDGKGRDQTKSVYMRIKELNDDAAMFGRRTFELDPATSAFDDVEKLLAQLAPYYDENWKQDEKDLERY